MNTTNEAVVAELQAQIAGLQDIVVAQAEAIKKGELLQAGCEAYNEILLGRLKLAEGSPLAEQEQEQALTDALQDRDDYHDIADRLANAIADYFLAEIGEHSSANCPWMRALEVVENAPQSPASAQPAEPAKELSDDWPSIASAARDSELLAAIRWYGSCAYSRAKDPQSAPNCLPERKAWDSIYALLARYGNSHVAQPAASAEPPIGYVHLVPDEHSDSYDVRFWKPVSIGTKLYTDPVAAQPSVPVGYILVPEKPTGEMLDALRTGSRKDWPSDELCRVRYVAMLEAAPTPPADGQAWQATDKVVSSPPRLYQHADGRYGLSFGPAQFAVNAPDWYSVPLDVVESGQQEADKVHARPASPPFAGYDPSFNPGSNPENPQTEQPDPAMAGDDERERIGQAINDFMAQHEADGEPGQCDLDWCDSENVDALIDAIFQAKERVQPASGEDA